MNDTLRNLKAKHECEARGAESSKVRSEKLHKVERKKYNKSHSNARYPKKVMRERASEEKKLNCVGCWFGCLLQAAVDQSQSEHYTITSTYVNE